MKKLHLISNAHIDPVWQWEWEEGAAVAISTFRTAADLCEQFDGFIFNHNEAKLYMWVEEYEPELFERIKKLVKAKKWNIMGGWIVQPDCNLPSGESFVRQSLYGINYFWEKFGVRPYTLNNFDPFGHTQGLAQILNKAGYKNAIVTSRLERSTFRALEKFGLTDFFDAILTASDTDKFKPDPTPIYMILDMIGCKPEESIFIGDTSNDIEAGKNAGIFTVLVGWSDALPVGKIRDEAPVPDVVIEKLTDIPVLLGLGVKKDCPGEQTEQKGR